MPEYCCTVRRFFASGWNRSRKTLNSGLRRLRIVFERDHGRQHVVAIVAARGAQPVLHAAAVAIDQQAAAARAPDPRHR
jgi:tRNA C32,U32 (ribose-2'-O)-methylase TrmJ